MPSDKALPGWNTYIGPGQTSTVIYDTVSLGGAAISLHDSASIFLQPFQGSYCAFLQGSGAGPATSVVIGQTGQIPIETASIRFWASPLANLEFTVDGQVIPLIVSYSTANYKVLGGDISPFAGQIRELRFTGPGNGGGIIDNIQFSNEPMPEPSALLLFGFGALLLGRHWLRRR